MERLRQTMEALPEPQQKDAARRLFPEVITQLQQTMRTELVVHVSDGKQSSVIAVPVVLLRDTSASAAPATPALPPAAPFPLSSASGPSASLPLVSVSARGQPISFASYDPDSGKAGTGRIGPGDGAVECSGATLELAGGKVSVKTTRPETQVVVFDALAAGWPDPIKVDAVLDRLLKSDAHLHSALILVLDNPNPSRALLNQVWNRLAAVTSATATLVAPGSDTGSVLHQTNGSGDSGKSEMKAQPIPDPRGAAQNQAIAIASPKPRDGAIRYIATAPPRPTWPAIVAAASIILVLIALIGWRFRGRKA